MKEIMELFWVMYINELFCYGCYSRSQGHVPGINMFQKRNERR